MNKKLVVLLFVILFVWNILLTIDLQNKQAGNNTDIHITQNNVNGFTTELTEVSENVIPSMVKIYSGGEISSGFVYENKDGITYIMTSAHGLASDEVTITLANHLSYEAKVLGKDLKSDIALLAVSLNFEVNPLNIAGNTQLNMGEFLLSFGAYQDQSLPLGVSIALVNEKNVTLEKYDDDMRRYYATYLAMTSTINPGISGGPITNMAGEVVAINMMIMKENEGLLLALPIAEAQIIADHMIDNIPYAKTEFGIHGKCIKDMENYEKAALNIALDIANGYYINNLIDDAFAYKIGLRSGDILMSVNSVAIYDYQDLLAMQYKEVDSYHFEVLRSGTKLNLNGVLFND